MNRLARFLLKRRGSYADLGVFCGAAYLAFAGMPWWSLAVLAVGAVVVIAFERVFL